MLGLGRAAAPGGLRHRRLRARPKGPAAGGDALGEPSGLRVHHDRPTAFGATVKGTVKI